MADYELRVKFTGLCLFVAHTNKQEVAVLQPNGIPSAQNSRKHHDATLGVPHLGYIRINPLNLAVDGTADKLARGEVIYRFGGHTLEFGIPAGEGITIDDPFPLPNFGNFAPTLVVPDELFSDTPGTRLLMRSVLRGGKLGGPKSHRRQLPQVLNPTPTDPVGQFSNKVTWKRKVSDKGITLRIRDFLGRTDAIFPLRFAGTSNVIELTIANLCPENPLQWPEFTFGGTAQDDEDFKWLYRLLDPPATEEYEQMLKGHPFPIPRLLKDTTSGVENCIGAIKLEQTFSLPDGEADA